MARYEYVCKDCGTAFELQRSMADAEGDVRCPNGHAAVRRRFSVYATSGAPEVGSGASAAGGCSGGACGCR